jgi:ATP-dependent exoDNAse (exonuclease V) beta subunit
MRVCRPADATVPGASAVITAVARGDDLTPIAEPPAGARLPVTEITGWPAPRETSPESGEAAAARLAGTLVHRLFRQLAPIDDGPSLQRHAAALLEPEERAGLDDAASFVAAVAATYAAMRAREDVQAIFEDGDPLFEVPFSWRVESGDVLRGTIDCLVVRPDGSVVVVDFKTGRERPGHREQLDVYVRAAATMFPDRRVDGILLYA